MIKTCWAFMLFGGLGQAVTNITLSGYACRAVYFRSSSSGRVLYVPKENNDETVKNNNNGIDDAMALEGRWGIKIYYETINFKAFSL